MTAAYLHATISTLLVGLASGYLVTAWLKGSLFAQQTAWLADGELQRWCDAKLGERAAAVAQKASEGLLCGLCLSPYVCAALHLLGWLCLGGYPLIVWPVATFASATVSVLVHQHISRDL